MQTLMPALEQPVQPLARSRSAAVGQGEVVIVGVFDGLDAAAQLLNLGCISGLPGHRYDSAAIEHIHAEQHRGYRFAGGCRTGRDRGLPAIEVFRIALHDRSFEPKQSRDGITEMVDWLDVPGGFDDLDPQGREVIGELQNIRVGNLKASQHHQQVTIRWDRGIA